MLHYISWNVDPVMFRIHAFGNEIPLGWYGLLFAFGLLLGQKIMLHVFHKEGKPSSDIELLTIYLVIATIIGARLGHFVFYEWDYLVESPTDWFMQLVTPPFSGLASHGASIGILLALYFYSTKKKDQSFLWVADRVVIPICLAGAFIRFGNLMNSEIYGLPTDLPWAFLFLRETDPSLLPVVPRHPTQIYEALFCIFLLIVTYYLWNKKRTRIPEGFTTGVFFIMLFSFRFMVEFLKNDQVDYERMMALNMGQILSIPSILTGILILVYANRKNQILKNPNQPEDLRSGNGSSENNNLI